MIYFIDENCECHLKMVLDWIPLEPSFRGAIWVTDILFIRQ